MEQYNPTFDLARINTFLHDRRVRFTYPEHGVGELIEREVTFKALKVSKAGSFYIGCVESSRDGAKVESYKNYTVAKVQDLELIKSLLDRLRVWVAGVWLSLLEWLSLGM